MTFEEAITESIRKYFEGIKPEKYSEIQNPKYTKDYFDDMETKVGLKEPEKPKRGRPKKNKDLNPVETSGDSYET